MIEQQWIPKAKRKPPLKGKERRLARKRARIRGKLGFDQNRPPQGCYRWYGKRRR